MSEQMEWQVQAILQRGTHNNVTHYLVKWKGFPIDQATWEPITHLDHCQDLVIKFQRSLVKNGKNGAKGNTEGAKSTKGKAIDLSKVFQKTDDICGKKERSNEAESELSHKNANEQSQSELKKCEPEPIQAQKRETSLQALQIVSAIDKKVNQSIVNPEKKTSSSLQNEVNQPKTTINQPKTTTNPQKKDLLKRIFQRMDGELEDLPNKKLKVQQNVTRRQQDGCGLRKEEMNRMAFQEKQASKCLNIQEKPPNIKLEHFRESECQSSSQRSQETSEKSIHAHQIESPLQPQTQVVQPNNQSTTTKIHFQVQKTSINEVLNEKSVACDNLLKEIQRKELKNHFMASAEGKLTKTSIFDLSLFPELLDQCGSWQILKQPGVQMEEVQALVRLNYGWIALGKVQGISSVVSIQNLVEADWTKLLQKYQ